jgi:hypothetical protein
MDPHPYSECEFKSFKRAKIKGKKQPKERYLIRPQKYRYKK